MFLLSLVSVILRILGGKILNDQFPYFFLHDVIKVSKLKISTKQQKLNTVYSFKAHTTHLVDVCLYQHQCLPLRNTKYFINMYSNEGNEDNMTKTHIFHFRNKRNPTCPGCILTMLSRKGTFLKLLMCDPWCSKAKKKKKALKIAIINK